jgi:hypothetical protein
MYTQSSSPSPINRAASPVSIGSTNTWPSGDDDNDDDDDDDGGAKSHLKPADRVRLSLDHETRPLGHYAEDQLYSGIISQDAHKTPTDLCPAALEAKEAVAHLGVGGGDRHDLKNVLLLAANESVRRTD